MKRHVFFTKKSAEKLSQKYAVPVKIVDYEDYKVDKMPVVAIFRLALSIVIIGQSLVYVATQSTIPLILNWICVLFLVFLTFVPLKSKPPHERS